MADLLSFIDDSSSTRQLGSTCKTFYQMVMSEKSQFIIKAMPVGAFGSLAALSAMLSRSTKKIGLTVRSPTLAMKAVPNKFINTITGFSNLTSLNISSFNLSREAQRKLVQLTNLERLSMETLEVNLSTLVRLTKLEVEFVTGFRPNLYRHLTTLLDLSVCLPVEHLEEISCLTQLTRLRIGVDKLLGNGSVVLTALSKLKKLHVFSHASSLEFIASCTTLESIKIDEEVSNNFNFKWMALNTQLTKFHVNTTDCLTNDMSPLTNLTNLSSIFICNSDQLKLFPELPHLTWLELRQLDKHFRAEDLAQYTALRSFKSMTTYRPHDFPTTLVNLEMLLWRTATPATFPTTVKNLISGNDVRNMKELTQLESLVFSSPSLDLDIDTEKLQNLTKIQFTIKDAHKALGLFQKLSNLFSLRYLSVIPLRSFRKDEPTVSSPDNYNLDTDFLTSLTNLEALRIPSLNISLQSFETIVQRYTQLTLLHVSSPDASGESLTQLTNLQVLAFYSSKQRRGLKWLLEDKLPRLTEIIVENEFDPEQ